MRSFTLIGLTLTLALFGCDGDDDSTGDADAGGSSSGGSGTSAGTSATTSSGTSSTTSSSGGSSGGTTTMGATGGTAGDTDGAACGKIETQMACEADAACGPILGQQIRQMGDTVCLQAEREYLGCGPLGCPEVITVVCEGGMRPAYQLPNGCIPEGFETCDAPPNLGMCPDGGG